MRNSNDFEIPFIQKFLLPVNFKSMERIRSTSSYTSKNITIEIKYQHTGQCKSTYNELVVAIFRTDAGVKGKTPIPVDFMIYELAFILFVMTPGAQCDLP